MSTTEPTAGCPTCGLNLTEAETRTHICPEGKPKPEPEPLDFTALWILLAILVMYCTVWYNVVGC